MPEEIDHRFTNGHGRKASAVAEEASAVAKAMADGMADRPEDTEHQSWRGSSGKTVT